jgi:acyl-CoA synthetase (AMP-forming)/AMP-acid ligase II
MSADHNAVRWGSVGDMSWPLERAARLFGSSEAVVDGDRSVTYAELARRVGALGASLDDLAVGGGRRVGFLGANSLAHAESWLGVPAFGRVLVDLNFRLDEPELGFMVEDCELTLLIVDQQQLEVGRALSPDPPNRWVEGCDGGSWGRSRRVGVR